MANWSLFIDYEMNDKGYLQGTSKEEVEKILTTSKIPILEIKTKSLINIIENKTLDIDNITFVYILPPSDTAEI